MKIVHSADWHLGKFPGPERDGINLRFQDTLDCIEFLRQKAVEEEPDIILIAGDLFHKSRLWSEQGIFETRTVLDLLGKLSRIAPLCILYGTPNHDGIENFRMLEQACGEIRRIHFFTSPALKTIETKAGPIQVTGVPGFDKGYFRAKHPGLSVEEENTLFTHELANIIFGLSAQLVPFIPSVLMSHYTVIGCELDNGQHVFQQNEVVLEASTLSNVDFDLVCLGHIHKAQKIDTISIPTFYSGDINRISFNEEYDDKGFFIHEIDEDLPYDNIKSRFIQTPARGFKTINWDQEAVQSYVDIGMDAFTNFETIENKIVRVIYSCDAAINKTFDKKKLERDLYAAGAFWVSEIRPDTIFTEVNREAFNNNLDPISCLDKYLQEKETKPEEISEIIALAKPIIDIAEAKKPAGRVTGLFEPVSIEVKNYRSYREESFDFSDVSFAMINGRNGIGKSALFMDAPSDCLYEKTREGELTGWISNDPDARSGSIIFTFKLGETMWRVTRTRAKSGKATLNLSEFTHGLSEDYPGSWVDRSCDKLTDTQQKIIDLLGMDSDTFQSCVLIMQDNYGKFMEADKENRMNVLGNLIGLSIYEDMEKIAKEYLTNINREIKTLNAEIADLEILIRKGTDFETEKKQYEDELSQVVSDRQSNQSALSQLNAEIAQMEQTKAEIIRLDEDITKKRNAVAEKINKKNELEKRVANAEQLINRQEEITAGTAEYELLKTEVEVLKVKNSQLSSLQIELKKLSENKMQLEGRLLDLQVKIDSLKSELSRIDEYKIISQKVTQTETELDEKLRLVDEFNKQNQNLVQLEHDLKNHMIASKATEDKYQNQIDSLTKRTELLNNSQCVDIEKASCMFLKDAKEAAEKIPELSKELENLKIINTQNQMKLQDDIDNAKVSLSLFDSEKLQANVKDLKNFITANSGVIKKLAALEASQNTLSVYEKNLEDMSKRLDDSIIEIKAKEDAVNELKSLVEPLSDKQIRLFQIEKYPQLLKNLEAAKIDHEHSNNQIKDLSNEIEGLTIEGKDLKQKIDELMTKILNLDARKQQLTQCTAEINKLQQSETSLNQKVGELSGKLKEIGQYKITLKNKVSMVTEKAAKAARLTTLSITFSQDGIPFQIIRDIVPELEIHANDILGKMTGGRMNLDMKTEKLLKSNKKEVATLDIIITDVDHGSLPYKARSGGQKVRSALAVNLALANIKASRVGLQLGMIFIDEPPFLDAEGTEAYCDALEEIHNKYPMMKILAISHDEDMKSRFPQQYQVVATDNGSKVLR